MERRSIEVSVDVAASMDTVWMAWTDPQHVVKWNFASDDWCCPRAENDLRVGGTFNYRMEAKDGSFGFDFEGKYTEISDRQRIAYVMADGRTVETTFEDRGETVTVTTVFDAEDQNSVDMQRDGWQAILDNFKTHAEGL